MSESYFNSDRFCNVDYWEAKWKARQHYYWYYMKWDGDFQGYFKSKEPIMPEGESATKRIIEQTKMYIKKYGEEFQVKESEHEKQ